METFPLNNLAENFEVDRSVMIKAMRNVPNVRWVNRVILALCRSLPVFTQLRTWRRAAITDAMGQ
jgi:hypothetical protein